MSDPDRLPNIGESQRTPLVEQLLGQIEKLLKDNHRQAEQIRQLRDEIAVLRGQKAKPKFRPSGMERETDSGGEANEGAKRRSRKRAGSSKRRVSTGSPFS